MSTTKSYEIGFWAPGGRLISTLKIDAAGRKDAEDVAKEIRDSILPILNIHYRSMGQYPLSRLKIIIL